MSRIRADGSGEKYVWDGSNLIYYHPNDNSRMGYAAYYGVNGIFASSDWTNYAFADYLYQKNAHGDVTALIDNNGNVNRYYRYDAFGTPGSYSADDTNPFLYAGQYYDRESQSYYLRARYYLPRYGRFTAEDPARDGLNWYTYCANNPVRYYDPSGLSGIMNDGTIYTTHPLDEELLKLKQEYVVSNSERQAEIAAKAKSIRESGKEGVDWSVQADRSLDYYMIDTDVTDKLNDLMASSERENSWKRLGVISVPTNIARYSNFASMVKPGGKYDLKSHSEWQGREHFIYNGEVIWYDDPGNILYGYLGKAMGFNDLILKSAGGAVQIATGTSSWNYVTSFFDDPRDQASIQLGIDKYKKSHFWIWW